MDINNYDIVADLYDIYVPVSYDLDFFLDETRKTTGEVLELMSGTGRVSIPLLDAGIKLTCVDISERSNAILRSKLEQKGLKADVFTLDICEMDLQKQFSMVIIPFASFAHITSQSDQRKALQNIYRHLMPGGIFICTLSNPVLRSREVDGQLRLANTYSLPNHQGNLLLWILEQFDPDDEHVVQAYEFFEQFDLNGVQTSRRLMELNFRLSPLDEFKTLLKDCGFSVQALYGDYAYHEFVAHSNSYLIWILQKSS